MPLKKRKQVFSKRRRNVHEKVNQFLRRTSRKRESTMSKTTICQTAKQLFDSLQEIKFESDFNKVMEKHFQDMAKHEAQTNNDIVLLGVYCLRVLSWWKWKELPAKCASFIERTGYKRELTSTFIRHAIQCAKLAIEGLDVWLIGGEHAHTSLVRRLVIIDKGDSKRLASVYIAGHLVDSLKTVVEGKATYTDGLEKKPLTLPMLSSDKVADEVFPLSADEQKKREDEKKEQDKRKDKMPWRTNAMTKEKILNWFNSLSNDDKELVRQSLVGCMVPIVAPIEKKRSKKTLASK